MDIIKYSRYTNTTKFIMPLLFNNIKYHELFQNFFINAYIGDVAKKENDDNIHLVFADYPSLSLQLQLTDPISEYKYNDVYVLVYPLEEEWLDDYNKLIKGEYSQISEEAKKRIIHFWDVDNTSVLWCVLYKEGNSIHLFLQDILGLKKPSKFSKYKEWWVDYKIHEEIIGLE